MADPIDISQEVTFSKDEAMVLKAILEREELLRKMSASVDGLEAINSLLSITIRGPVKIFFKWNKVLIKTWKKANERLYAIASSETCKDINLMYVDASPGSANFVFWSNLRATMGC